MAATRPIESVASVIKLLGRPASAIVGPFSLAAHQMSIIRIGHQQAANWQVESALTLEWSICFRERHLGLAKVSLDGLDLGAGSGRLRPRLVGCDRSSRPSRANSIKQFNK